MSKVKKENVENFYDSKHAAKAAEIERLGYDFLECMMTWKWVNDAILIAFIKRMDEIIQMLPRISQKNVAHYEQAQLKELNKLVDLIDPHLYHVVDKFGYDLKELPNKASLAFLEENPMVVRKAPYGALDQVYQTLLKNLEFSIPSRNNSTLITTLKAKIAQKQKHLSEHFYSKKKDDKLLEVRLEVLYWENQIRTAETKALAFSHIDNLKKSLIYYQKFSLHFDLKKELPRLYAALYESPYAHTETVKPEKELLKQLKPVFSTEDIPGELFLHLLFMALNLLSADILLPLLIFSIIFSRVGAHLETTNTTSLEEDDDDCESRLYHQLLPISERDPNYVEEGNFVIADWMEDNCPSQCDRDEYSLKTRCNIDWFFYPTRDTGAQYTYSLDLSRLNFNQGIKSWDVSKHFYFDMADLKLKDTMFQGPTFINFYSVNSTGTLLKNINSGSIVVGAFIGDIHLDAVNIPGVALAVPIGNITITNSKFHLLEVIRFAPSELLLGNLLVNIVNTTMPENSYFSITTGNANLTMQDSHFKGDNYLESYDPGNYTFSLSLKNSTLPGLLYSSVNQRIHKDLYQLDIDAQSSIEGFHASSYIQNITLSTRQKILTLTGHVAGNMANTYLDSITLNNFNISGNATGTQCYEVNFAGVNPTGAILDDVIIIEECSGYSPYDYTTAELVPTAPHHQKCVETLQPAGEPFPDNDAISTAFCSKAKSCEFIYPEPNPECEIKPVKIELDWDSKQKILVSGLAFVLVLSPALHAAFRAKKHIQTTSDNAQSSYGFFLKKAFTCFRRQPAQQEDSEKTMLLNT